MKESMITAAGAMAAGFLIVITFVLGAGADHRGPEITFLYDITYSEGQDISVLLDGVSALDDRDGDVTADIMVDSLIVLNENRFAKVTYTAKDKSNNITKASRIVGYEGSGKSIYSASASELLTESEGLSEETRAGTGTATAVGETSSGTERTSTAVGETSAGAGTISTVDGETNAGAGTTTTVTGETNAGTGAMTAAGETSSGTERTTTAAGETSAGAGTTSTAAGETSVGTGTITTTAGETSAGAGTTAAEETTAARSTEKPVLTLSTREATINAGDRFNIAAYVGSVTDNKDSREALYRRIGIDGSYDTKTAGTYIFKVYCIDSDRNISNKESFTLHVMEQEQ